MCALGLRILLNGYISISKQSRAMSQRVDVDATFVDLIPVVGE